MKNIHLIPTDKPSNITIRKRTGELVYDAEPFTHDEWDVISNQNIYITSDEEIKEGDWFIVLDGSNDIYKANKVWLDIIKENSNPSQKIILTTDQDLIKDDVQSIDYEFLEWFVKNPSCEEVEVGKTNKLIDNYAEKHEYKWEVKYQIYIPKEEPKQHVEFINNNIEEFDNKLKEFFNLKNISSENIPSEFNDIVNKEFFNLIEEPKQETLEEVVFIKKAIDFYWSQYNSNHIDNLKDFEVSKKIIEQLKNK